MAPGAGRILWSAGVRTTRCCGLGPKRCAQWFEALRRGRNGSEGSKVEGRGMSALHPYGGGCAPAGGPSSVVAEPEEPRITRMTPIGKAVGRKGAKGQRFAKSRFVGKAGRRCRRDLPDPERRIQAPPPSGLEYRLQAAADRLKPGLQHSRRRRDRCWRPSAPSARRLRSSAGTPQKLVRPIGSQYQSGLSRAKRGDNEQPTATIRVMTIGCLRVRPQLCGQ
jgi:hypothetical protein